MRHMYSAIQVLLLCAAAAGQTQISTQSNQNIELLPNGAGLCVGCTNVVSVEKYVIQNSRTDIALAINDACLALPATGGILDARDVPMPMEWASNPWNEGSNTCSNSRGTVVLLLNAGAVCYNVPIATGQGRVRIYGAGTTTLSTSSMQGTWFIPVNSSGAYHAYCDSLSMSNFPQKPTVALGGPFPTSWIGLNGTVNNTISSMTCTSGACSIKASNTLPLNFCSATSCPPATSFSGPASYVYVGGNSIGLCNGSYQITGISTTTNTSDTFTYTTASGCNSPTIANTFVMAANANAGILDGQFAGTANTTQGQFCANSTFEHSWFDLVMVGNGIPSFVPYFNCGAQENSVANNLVIGDSTLAQWVDDSTSFGPVTGGASHMHRRGVFAYLSNNATLGSQKCSISALAGTSQTQTLNDTTLVTCATFTNAPVVLNWVYITTGTATGLTPGYYQVVTNGMGGCTTVPSTTSFCINTPGQSSAACSSCGATASYGPWGMVMEGFKPDFNQATGGYEDCCWDTTAGASTTKQLWASKWVSGTYGLIAIKEHGEQLYQGQWDIGEGNTIDRWINLPTGDVTQTSNLQSIDAGGSNQPQGPGWGTGTGAINLPSAVRLGPNAFNTTLTSIYELFGNSSIYQDVGNLASLQSTGSGEGIGIGQYSQGIQPVPACYSGTGACQRQASGIAQIPTSASSVVISTSAVTANSNIQLNFMVGNAGGLTCGLPGNLSSLGNPYVSARTAGTSFTISLTAGLVDPTTNALCVAWSLIN
jgi:hypothetical protein